MIREVCVLCGCGRTTDTWAQDRETGRQGLRSVSYSPGEYADDVLQVEVQRVIPLLTAAGCEAAQEAAAYVLLAARGEDIEPSRGPLSELSDRQVARADEVVDYLGRVWRAVPRGTEERAMRLALRLAADGEAEERIASAVLAAM